MITDSMKKHAYQTPSVSIEALGAESHLMTASEVFHGELGSRETLFEELELDINDPISFIGMFNN